MIKTLLAQAGSQRTELSLPVGGDVLPGGQLITPQTGIQESILFSKIIPFAITYTIRAAVAVAVIALIIGGYQYITSFGNSEKQDKATKTITYAIIGLIIAITAFGIVTIITNFQFT